MSRILWWLGYALVVAHLTLAVSSLRKRDWPYGASSIAWAVFLTLQLVRRRGDR